MSQAVLDYFWNAFMDDKITEEEYHQFARPYGRIEYGDDE